MGRPQESPTPARSPNRSRAALAASTALLAGCIFVPQTVEQYDPECQVMARRMELTAVQVAGISGCSNTGCAALLVAAGATAAASAVVSGSITLAGNVVYWLEKQGRCIRAR